MKRTITHSILAFTLLALLGCASTAPVSQPQKLDAITAKKTKASAIVFTPQTTAYALMRTPRLAWSPSVTANVQRGATQYEDVAPAVVVVRTQNGHGTGFFVSADGLIVTNNHVIREGMWNDSVGSYAAIHTGHLGADGIMKMDDEPIHAHLLKRDPIKDLALLKLDAAPRAMPFLQIANDAPRPGLHIAIVGHPSSGMLWTYRSGEVASVGYSPTDIVNVVMEVLATKGTAREFVSKSQQQKIILTSAGVNPGDSGGPVVDSDNRVVAVTYAIPAAPGEKVISYHVHLDELKDFLSSVPTQPAWVIPDPWEIGPEVKLVDLDDDGRAEVMASGTQSIDELMFDLTGSTPPALLDDEHLGDLVDQRAFHFDVAVRTSDGTAFYDRDGDGTIDLILSSDPADPDRVAGRFVRNGGAWTWDGAPAAGPLIDASYLGSGARATRFAKLLQAIQ